VVLAYFLLSWDALIDSGADENPELLSVAVIGLVLWTIYVVSQWVSQAISILPAAVVLAPVLSVVSLIWAVYAITEFDAKIWWLLLCSLLPVASTALMMRRFMDGRRGWVGMTSVIVVALGLIIGPAIPFLIDVATAPDVSKARLQEMQALARQVRPASATPITRNWLALSQLTAEEKQQAYQQAGNPRSQLMWEQDDTDASALTIDSTEYWLIEQDFVYSKATFLSSPTDADAQQQLRNWLEVLTEFAWRLRLSSKCSDQMTADLLEVMLVEALSDEAIRSIPELDLTLTTELFQNTARRNQGRKAAVLAFWKKGDGRDLLGYHRLFLGQSVTRVLLTEGKTFNLVADAMLRLIEASETGKPTLPIKQELFSMLWGPEVPYSQFSPANYRGYGLGHAWFEPWETTAIDLAALFKSQVKQVNKDSQSATTGDEP
jgi:hypothetical protein